MNSREAGKKKKNSKGSKLSLKEIHSGTARSFLSLCFSCLRDYPSRLVKNPPLKDFKAPSKVLQLFRVSAPYLLT